MCQGWCTAVHIIRGDFSETESRKEQGCTAALNADPDAVAPDHDYWGMKINSVACASSAVASDKPDTGVLQRPVTPMFVSNVWHGVGPNRTPIYRTM